MCSILGPYVFYIDEHLLNRNQTKVLLLFQKKAACNAGYDLDIFDLNFGDLVTPNPAAFETGNATNSIANSGKIRSGGLVAGNAK